MDFVEQAQINHEAVLGHWYYQAKFGLLCRALAATGLPGRELRLLDIGCGLGVFLTLLERSGRVAPAHMSGIDPAAPDGAHSMGGTIPIYREKPEASGPADVILLMDVLEHVADDRALLTQARDGLAPGGYVFLTVPAFQALWSRHDEVLGHYRRYTTAGVRKLIGSVPGLKIARLHYFYASILPPAALVRLARRGATNEETDLAPCHPALNATLRAVLAAESSVARFNKIAGLTAVALCRKSV